MQNVARSGGQARVAWPRGHVDVGMAMLMMELKIILAHSPKLKEQNPSKNILQYSLRLIQLLLIKK